MQILPKCRKMQELLAQVRLKSRKVQPLNAFAMLDYVKTVLSKVSFDRALFEKELRKALAMLVPEEIYQLRDWCYRKFGNLYENILNKHFEAIV
jgi:hypothetical protein